MIDQFISYLNALGFHSLKDLLDVMLVPLIIAVLAPLLTRRWQYRQKALELKTEIVADISKLVMRTVMIVDLANDLNNGQNTEQDLDKTLKEWEVDNCIIGSKIHAYFPAEEKGDEQLHKKWGRFAKSVTEYYAKQKNLKKGQYGTDLGKERENILDQKAKVIQEILDSNITGLH